MGAVRMFVTSVNRLTDHSQAPATESSPPNPCLAMGSPRKLRDLACPWRPPKQTPTPHCAPFSHDVMSTFTLCHSNFFQRPIPKPGKILPSLHLLVNIIR
jgi:hypothetical protein